MQLQRFRNNPILKPNPLNPWESVNVFNCGVVYSKGLFHMLYRAQGSDFTSSIGYAVSEDGFHFNRLQQPVLSPQDESDAWGVEDPRITELTDEGRFIMAYTAYSPQGITPMFAESDNLIVWKRIGPLVTGEDNKDHVLFPRKVGGRYLAFHRRPPCIWLAESADLRSWGNFRPVMVPRPESWDCKRVGAGGVPIETPFGWLCIYHAYDHDHVYRFGACLLDLEDPTRVIARTGSPIMEPLTPWELRGDIPHTIFSTANPVVDGILYVYYGGADRFIGVATCPVSELLDFTLAESRETQGVSA